MVHRGQAGILIALALAGLVLAVYFWRKKRQAAKAGA
jgi:LPXTG-motif cell wall-anchored protein